MRGRRLYVDEPDVIEAAGAAVVADVVAEQQDFERDMEPDKTPDAASDVDAVKETHVDADRHGYDVVAAVAADDGDGAKSDARDGLVAEAVRPGETVDVAV